MQVDRVIVVGKLVRCRGAFDKGKFIVEDYDI